MKTLTREEKTLTREKFLKEYLGEWKSPWWEKYQMIYVLSGRSHFANDFARHNEVPKNKWRWLGREESCHGIINSLVVISPTFGELPEWERIGDIILYYERAGRIAVMSVEDFERHVE